MNTRHLMAATVICMIATLFGRGSSPAQEPGADDALYISRRQEITIGYENLVIRKRAGRMRFIRITEIGNGPDIQLRFEDANGVITTTITIFRAPDGTFGPGLVFGEDGEPKPADKTKNPNAEYEYTEPSESYTNEFYKIVLGMEAVFRLKSATEHGKPFIMPAVQGDLVNSPVAYATTFTGTGEFRDPAFKDTPWLWEYRLYVVGRHYVKIHTEGPQAANIPRAGRDITNAIKWIPDKME